MNTPEFGSSKLGVESAEYGMLDIDGVRVEIRLVTLSLPKENRPHFCVYANLKNSRFLKDFFISSATFRKDDWVGVDTAHGYNFEMDLAMKLLDGLNQMEDVIKKWKEAINDEVRQ